MDFDALTRTIDLRPGCCTIIRPGIALCLLYSEPVATLAPAIADILTAYMEFIPSGTLRSYLSRDGTWRELSKRALTTILKDLKSIPPGAKGAEFHLSQGEPTNVGSYGTHFKGYPLDEEVWPLEDNILYLEFPYDILDHVDGEAFFDFVHKVAIIRAFDSGFCGYAFKQLHMTFRDESFQAISQMAMRYIGFDISSDKFRICGRGRVCNVSWLTLFGRDLVGKLGGFAQIQRALSGMNVTALDSGVMVQASDLPIIGDVNRGAGDAAPLRELARFTRPFRMEASNLGPTDPAFADRWLSRFDSK